MLAAQTGATLAELTGRLGHSTPGAAMRYQHAAADRDAEIAKRLSALASTPWLKALGDGLHEFRVRHDASTIEGLAGHEPAEGLPTQKKILLRLFVHVHGNKVVLLVHGYDKGSDDSPRQQGKEIQEARKRLARWRVAEAKRAKKK